MTLNILSYHTSIANFLEKTEVENEDHISIDESGDQFFKYAICDGAGGAGVFSGEWAKFLADAVPVNPFVIEKDSKWLFETSQNFHDNVISKKNLSDLILNKKIYKDGSFSTLCTCWLDIIGNKLYYSAIGDTYLFIFQKNGDGFVPVDVFPINDQQEIDEKPHLLNWNIELQTELPLKEFPLKTDFVILLASDSLAKWIILNLFLSDSVRMSGLEINQKYMDSLSTEKNLIRKESIARGSGVKSVNNLLFFLKDISKDKNKFISTLNELNRDTEIDIDDYSLIYIEGNVSQ